MSGPSKTNESEAGAFFVLVAIGLVVAAWYLGMFPHLLHGQTPSLVVSAGSGNLANSLSLTSDSAMPWKAFTVSGGTPGSYNLIWAESNGTVGGIYFGSISTSSSGPAAVPAPGPAPAPAADLPLAALQTAASAAIAGVPAADVAAMANTYEALAKQVDAGTIVSPLQLQLATGTHLLASFNADQLATFKQFTAAVCGWLDAQQCAGKLTADRMDRYSRSYHAVAAALGVKPAAAAGYVVAPVAPHRGETAPAVQKSEVRSQKSKCPDGKCPAPDQLQWTHRWRPWLDQ